LLGRVTIHSENPFLDPTPDQTRRVRGRLGGTVTLWTSGVGAQRAGLTVSSLMIATGRPASVLGLLDPDSDLRARLVESGRAVVQLLEWHHRGLAEMFAGTAPAPGGVFAQAAFTDTPWGPKLDDATTWLGVELTEVREVGWSTLVTCSIESEEIGDEGDPLMHRRGRYAHASDDSA
jgi:flavin reductase (DIM6/NTAB) family NADH-FMN oxidoreductase RutF